MLQAEEVVVVVEVEEVVVGLAEEVEVSEVVVVVEVAVAVVALAEVAVEEEGTNDFKHTEGRLLSDTTAGDPTMKNQAFLNHIVFTILREAQSLAKTILEALVS